MQDKLNDAYQAIDNAIEANVDYVKVARLIINAYKFRHHSWLEFNDADVPDQDKRWWDGVKEYAHLDKTWNVLSRWKDDRLK